MNKVIKRTICGIVTIALILGLVPNMGEVKEVQAAGYNASAALVYASQHWNDQDGSLCAEFVSNCLRAGGVEAWSKNVDNMYSALKDTGIGQVFELSRNGATIPIGGANSGKVSPGDVLIFQCGGAAYGCGYSHSTGYVHTALVGTSDDGYVHIYQHAEARNNVKCSMNYCYLGKKNSIAHVYVYHFNSDPTAPVISNVKVINVSADSFTVECDVTDNVGVASVKFPTWPAYRDCRPEEWRDSMSVNGNHYSFTLRTEEYNFYRGQYYTHIYAYDAAGNYSCVGAPVPTLPQYLSGTATMGSHTYELYTSNCRWADAKKLAESKGGHLVTITSNEENDVIKELVKRGDFDAYWMGATDEVSEGSFEWVTGEEFSYKGSGGFDNAGGNENYLGIWNGNWNDFAQDYCFSSCIGYIVEFEPEVTEASGTFNNHEYIVYNDSVTATQARTKEGSGYHLTTITSEDEYNYIMELTKRITKQPSGYWLGANDNDYEGHFLWETGEPFVYNKWPDGQPDNKDGDTGGVENYLGIWSSGIWNDFSENNKLGYVLEKDPAPSKANGTFGNHEYYVSAEYLTRAEAESLQADGWYLATITSKQERDYVVGLINELSEKNLQGYWLGGNDVAKEGTFVWENGEPFSFTDWESGQPSNANRLGQNENYLVMRNNGQFNDENESYYNGYILERDPESKKIKVDSISLVSDRDETNDAYEGDTFQLTATVLPDNATDKSVKWASSDESYATVDNNGKVSVLASIPNSIKTIAITASSSDGLQTTEYSFVVCPKSSCEHIWDKGKVIKESTCSEHGEKELTCTKCGTKKTETLELKEHTAVKDNAVPATCNGTGLTEGSHCSICNAVLVEQKAIPRLSHEYDEGKVKAEPTEAKEGTKVFTCKLCGDKKEESIPKLSKQEEESDKKAVEGISLNENRLSMNKGDLYTLTVQITPDEATDKEIKWSSNNVNVAMVNSEGAVAAIARGRTTITATAVDGDKKAMCIVTVWDKYDKPDAPVLKASTIDSIEMKAVSGCEYSINGEDWQSSSTFTDLKEDTEYTIYMRRIANDSEYYMASESSDGTVVKTASKKQDTSEQEIQKPDEKDVEQKTSEQQTSEQPKPQQKTTEQPSTKQQNTQAQQSTEQKTTETAKPKSVSGVGTISPDGITLTDSYGTKYFVSEKITASQLKKSLKVADKKSGGKFKITKITKKSGKVTGGTVTYMAPYNKKCTKASIPNAIKIGGVRFTVTELNKNAFKACPRLVRVDIGANITKIGANAFRACGKLKTINFKTIKLKSIGGNAFTNINKNAKIKVQKGTLTRYSKLIRKADVPKKVVILDK